MRAHSFAAITAVTCAGGCVAPLIHPLRASNGPVGELATSLSVTGGRRGDCDDSGCHGTGKSSVALDSLTGSAGYSHVFAGHLGLMAGASFPAPRGYIVPVALWSFATVQNEFLSLGIGPDVGVGGGGATAGAELEPWGDAPMHPRFGVYGRYFWPFAPKSIETDMDGHIRAWEIGGRLRFGPIYLQYAYQTHPAGVVAMTWESDYAETRHVITLGLTLDSQTVKVFSDLERPARLGR